MGTRIKYVTGKGMVRGIIPFFMRRPVQRKYATKVAHGPRASRGQKILPYSIAQGTKIFLFLIVKK